MADRVKISNTFLRQLSFSFKEKSENSDSLFHVKKPLHALAFAFSFFASFKAILAFASQPF
jgi:hypothetical protein